MKAILELSEDEPVRAAQQLVRLADRTRRVSRESVGDWHYEQALGLAALTLAGAGHHVAAARLCRRLASHYQRSLAYYGRALASVETQRGLSLFAAGQHRPAARATREALRWAGQYGETGSALEDLLGKYREFLNDTARRRGRKRRRTRGGAA